MARNTRKQESKNFDKIDTNQLSAYTSVKKRMAASKTHFLKVLKSSMGVVSLACKNSGISRATYYQWMNSDPDFRRKVDMINEHAIDFVESKMFEAINNGDRQLIQFFLSTRGKKRGYTTKIEVQQDKRSTVQLNVTQFENEY